MVVWQAFGVGREGYIKELRDLVGTMPLFMPSVAVMVRDGDRVVAGRHRDVGMWVIPGGALEPGELPAEAAIREVWEETGLHVRLTGIHGVYAGTDDHRVTYPNGDVVNYAATVFDAEVVAGELHPETSELAELRWVDVDTLRTMEIQPWLIAVLEHRGFEPTSWEPPPADLDA